MSERLTRKEIKQDIREDEVQSFLINAIEKFQERPSFYVGILGALLALGVAIVGVVAFMDSRQDAANFELAKAMEVFDGQVVEEGTEPEGSTPTFASDEERRAQAKAAFAEVSGGAAGDVAELYKAEMAIQEGDTATARTIWEGFLRDHSDHVLAVSVRINLIHLDRQEDRAEQVAAELQSELDSANKSLPEDVILFELAQTREALGEQEAAIELYQRILDEYPQSPYSADARRITTAAS